MTTQKPRTSSANRHIDLDLARRLVDSGLSQNKAAKVLGCSQPNLSQRFRAQRKGAQAVTTPRTPTLNVTRGDEANDATGPNE